jgi:hypothetical protein
MEFGLAQLTQKVIWTNAIPFRLSDPCSSSNPISDVMVSVLASSAVDRVKPKTIQLVCVASPNDEVGFVDQHAYFICIVLAHWNNRPRIDMSLESDILSRFRANQSLLLHINAACFKQRNSK